MYKVAITILFALILAPSSPVKADWFGPSSKDECVEKYLDDAQTDFAAKLVFSACDRLFDPKPADPAKHDYWRKWRGWAKCYLDDYADKGNDLAIKRLLGECREKEGKSREKIGTAYIFPAGCLVKNIYRPDFPVPAP